MVDSDSGEERLARIEHMLEQLQNESAAFQSTTIALFDAVTTAARSKRTIATPGVRSATRRFVVLHGKKGLARS